MKPSNVKYYLGGRVFVWHSPHYVSLCFVYRGSHFPLFRLARKDPSIETGKPVFSFLLPQNTSRYLNVERNTSWEII